jgi:hypothetical protein
MKKNPEQKVMACLNRAWSEFLKLERQHPDELDEFRHGIHHLQGLMAMRVARRHEPEDWPTYPESDPDPATATLFRRGELWSDDSTCGYYCGDLAEMASAVMQITKPVAFSCSKDVDLDCKILYFVTKCGTGEVEFQLKFQDRIRKLSALPKPPNVVASVDCKIALKATDRPFEIGVARDARNSNPGDSFDGNVVFMYLEIRPREPIGVHCDLCGKWMPDEPIENLERIGLCAGCIQSDASRLQGDTA